MSDIILDSIKSFLYERQCEGGRLDGTLYLCSGNHNITNKNFKCYGKEFDEIPKYLIMERHKYPPELKSKDIFFKVYINNSCGYPDIINDKNLCEIHYFKNPTGAILLLLKIFQSVIDHDFTFIIEGNSIANYGLFMSSKNYNLLEGKIHIHLHNILLHFENIDFVAHQHFNPFVGN